MNADASPFKTVLDNIHEARKVNITPINIPPSTVSITLFNLIEFPERGVSIAQTRSPIDPGSSLGLSRITPASRSV